MNLLKLGELISDNKKAIDYATLNGLLKKKRPVQNANLKCL